MDVKLSNGYEIRIRYEIGDTTHICITKDGNEVSSMSLKDNELPEKVALAQSIVRYTGYSVVERGPCAVTNHRYVVQPLDGEKQLVQYHGSDRVMTDLNGEPVGYLKDYQIIKEWDEV